MSTAALTIPDFLTAIKTQMTTRLAGEPSLAGVIVQITPPAADEIPDGDFLYLVAGKIADVNKLATASELRSRDETIRIPGIVQGYAVSKTGGDDASLPALQRAVAILSELVMEIRDHLPQVGRQTRSGIVSNVSWEPIAVDKGGWIWRGSYELTYTSRVT